MEYCSSCNSGLISGGGDTSGASRDSRNGPKELWNPSEHENERSKQMTQLGRFDANRTSRTTKRSYHTTSRATRAAPEAIRTTRPTERTDQVEIPGQVGGKMDLETSKMNWSAKVMMMALYARWNVWSNEQRMLRVETTRSEVAS